MEDKEKDDAYTEDELRSFLENSTKQEGYFFEKKYR